MLPQRVRLMDFSPFYTSEVTPLLLLMFLDATSSLMGKFGILEICLLFRFRKMIVSGFTECCFNARVQSKKLHRFYNKFEEILRLFLLREMKFLLLKTTTGREVCF